MFQGVYNLASQVLTENRNLDVISNNMANVSTPGFKSDKMTATTFKEELVTRISGQDLRTIGSMAKIRTADGTITDFSDGGYRASDSPLDFAIEGKGFFTIQTEEGEVYTRDGSFITDEEGFLCLPGVGRVLGEAGPIQLTTDNVTADAEGNIISLTDDTVFGKLRITDFEDYAEQLVKDGNGVFVAEEAGTPALAYRIHGNAVEGSNVDAIQQMTEMMSSQRALQSATQVLKMYDQLTGKIVTQLGPS